MVVLTLFVILIFLLLVGFGVAGYLAWQKMSLYLTWNTRNESLEYEREITTPKLRKVARPASKTEQRGRAIKQVDDLVDLKDLDFDTAVEAIESMGK